MKTDYLDILKFWFDELNPADWFSNNPKLDLQMRERFSGIHASSERGELSEWRRSPEGRLAEILLLDQFSRNIYRGKAEAYKNDPVALVLAQEMVILNLDMKLDKRKRSFVYMPFMHSESILIHEQAHPLFLAIQDEELLKYEILHKEIIEKFGRYPHRNAILSRMSSPEEKDFLAHHPGF